MLARALGGDGKSQRNCILLCTSRSQRSSDAEGICTISVTLSDLSAHFSISGTESEERDTSDPHTKSRDSLPQCAEMSAQPDI